MFYNIGLCWLMNFNTSIQNGDSPHIDFVYGIRMYTNKIIQPNDIQHNDK